MTNIAAILEPRLGPPRVELLRSAARAASDLGLSLHLVGGSVRDSLLGQTPTDLDVSYTVVPTETSDQPCRRGGFETRPDPDVADALAHALGGVASDRSRFGTAKLRAGGVALDLVMARRETYAAPGALPTVEPGSLAGDLARRDFSINAMAVSLSAESWGDLADPFDGAGDLERRAVRVLHPGSFRDDATRLLRAARYAGRLGFRLEPETERLAREGASYVDTISGDRVRHELERIFDEPRAADILRIADGLGLLRAIHPALRPAERPDTIEGERGPAMLAGLALGLSPHEAEEVAERLNLGSEWSRVVRDTAAVRELLPSLESDLPPSRVYRLLHGRHESAVSAAAPTAPVGAPAGAGTVGRAAAECAAVPVAPAPRVDLAHRPRHRRDGRARGAARRPTISRGAAGTAGRPPGRGGGVGGGGAGAGGAPHWEMVR